MSDSENIMEELTITPDDVPRVMRATKAAMDASMEAMAPGAENISSRDLSLCAAACQAAALRMKSAAIRGSE